MSEPTQAQIDAAVTAMRALEFKVSRDVYIDLAKAALTAAQVECDCTGYYDICRRQKQIEATTIERCAQVAEESERVDGHHNYGSHASSCRVIAATIRALKDKP